MIESIKKGIFLIILLSSTSLQAQQDSVWKQKPQLNIGVFADVFYVYDLNEPKGTQRQPFLYNHNRHNEFNLNLGLVQFNIEHKKYRGKIGIQTGTYANDNYSQEPGLLKNIFEANVGVALNKNNSLWIDAGILPSHIGFESAISMDNLTLTRSLSAENSPYFLTGVKVTFSPNEKWELAGLITNGWQRIQRLDGNSLLSFGTQVNYSPSEKVTLNWSTFVGTDSPDSTRQMRYFNNLYGQFDLGKKGKLIVGIDAGMQQRSKNSKIYDAWVTPVIIGQLAFNNRWKMSLRAEYYQDKIGIIIPTGTVNGFQTTGLSLNVDYHPTKNIACRLEGRWLNSKDKIFVEKNSLSYNNFIIGASLAIKLLKKGIGN